MFASETQSTQSSALAGILRVPPVERKRKSEPRASRVGPPYGLEVAPPGVLAQPAGGRETKGFRRRA